MRSIVIDSTVVALGCSTRVENLALGEEAASGFAILVGMVKANIQPCSFALNQRCKS